MKKIPLYNAVDLKSFKNNENSEVEIFADFISQLLQQQDELSSQERQFIDKIDREGTGYLNDNQRCILENIVSRYEKKCDVCNEEIALNEVFHLGKFCSNHDYLNDEEK